MKLKKGVQVVEEPKPNQEKSSEEPPGRSDVDADDRGSGAVSVPKIPIDLSSIDPAKIALAEKFGIPINQILSWMASVEERFNTIEKVLPEKIGAELQRAITKARAEAPPAADPRLSGPPAGNPGVMGNLGGLLQILPQILSQQPQSNDLLAELSAKALKSQIGMSEAITNAVISKIAAKATDEVAGAVTGA